MTVSQDVQRQVRERAGERCEYCRMHQALQGGTFHVEHIVPRSRGGRTDLENLAWACPGCNLHKADQVEAADPQTNDRVPFFDPRRDIWNDHFAWADYTLIPLTAIGRATIRALDLNHSRRVRIRRAEELFGLFPPED